MKSFYIAGGAFVLAVALFFVLQGDDPAGPAPSPNPISPGGGQEEVFSGTFTPGYEGEFYEVEYVLRHPADLSVSLSGNSATRVVLEDPLGGRSNISFVWNGAAGFSTGEEVWEGVGLEQGCVPLESGLVVPRADRAWYGRCGARIAAAYFDRPSGIIVAGAFAGGPAFAERILNSLTIKISPIEGPTSVF